MGQIQDKYVLDCLVYYQHLEAGEQMRGQSGASVQKTAAYSLLQQGFLEYFQIELGEGDILSSDNGKPYYTKNPECYFNISHCSRGVAVAFAKVAVGVDIEAIRPVQSSLARRVLTKREWNYVFEEGKEVPKKMTLNEEEQRRFIRLWTLKESYVKMTGEGLRFPLNEVEFPLWRGTRAQEKEYYYCLREMSNVILSLCLFTAEKEQYNINIRKWSGEENEWSK